MKLLRSILFIFVCCVTLYQLSFALSPATSFDSNVIVLEPDFLNNFSIPSTFALFTEFPPPGKAIEAYVSIADPILACEPLKNPPKSVEGTIIVAYRGNCEFYEKAQHIEQAGAIGFLVANTLNKELVVPAWGSKGTTDVLPIFGASISGADGEDLVTLVRENNIAVKLRLTGPYFIGSSIP